MPFDGVCTWIATPTPIRRESGEMYVTRLPSGRLMRILTGEDTADVGQTIVHRKRIPEAHITPAIEDLKSAEFKRFKSNFIAVITGNAPGPMNWYDDEWWATICHNIGMIARVAKQGRCKGILIDPEVYSYSWWGYDRLTEAQGPTKPYRRGNKEFYAGKSVEDVMAKAMEIAEKIAANGPLAVKAIRRSAKACLGKPEAEALRIETEVSAPVFQTEDAKEGPRAFMEKRAPVYHGR